MMPILNAEPRFIYNEQDLFEISGYVNGEECDTQTNIDIQECLGAEFAIMLWSSKSILDTSTNSMTLPMPQVNDKRMHGMEIKIVLEYLTMNQRLST